MQLFQRISKRKLGAFSLVNLPKHLFASGGESFKPLFVKKHQEKKLFTSHQSSSPSSASQNNSLLNPMISFKVLKSGNNLKNLMNQLASENTNSLVKARDYLFILKNLLVIGKEDFLASKVKNDLWKRVLAEFETDHRKNIYDLSAFTYLFYESIHKQFGLTGKEENIFLNRQRLEYYEDNFLDSVGCKKKNEKREQLQYELIKSSFESLAAEYDKSYYQTMGFYYFFYNAASLRNIMDPTFLKFYREFFKTNYETLSLSHKIEVLIQYVLCNLDVDEYKWLLDKVSIELDAFISKGEIKINTKFPKQFERSEVMEYHLSLSRDSTPMLKVTPQEMQLKNITDFFWIASRKFSFFRPELLIKFSDVLEQKADDLSVLDKINVFYAKTVLYSAFKTEPLGPHLRKSAECFFKKLEPQISQHIQSSFPNSKPNCLLYQCLVFWQLDYEKDQGGFFPQVQTAKLMEALEHNWKEVSLKKINESYTEKIITSKIEKVLKNNNAVEQFQKNPLVGIYTVDLLIPPKKIIEINGDAHYSYKTKEDGHGKELCLNGNYLMKLNILKMMGYDICLINNEMYMSLLDKEVLLEDYLRKAIQ